MFDVFWKNRSKYRKNWTFTLFLVNFHKNSWIFLGFTSRYFEYLFQKFVQFWWNFINFEILHDFYPISIEIRLFPLFLNNFHEIFNLFWEIWPYFIDFWGISNNLYEIFVFITIWIIFHVFQVILILFLAFWSILF